MMNERMKEMINPSGTYQLQVFLQCTWVPGQPYALNMICIQKQIKTQALSADKSFIFTSLRQTE